MEFDLNEALILADSSPETFVLWLNQNDFINIDGKICEHCGSTLILQPADYEPEKYVLRCSNFQCYHRYSIRTGSFFEDKRLKIVEILQIFQGFVLEDSILSTAQKLNVDRHTVSAYYKSFRQRISVNLRDDPIIFFEHGVYEADETEFFHMRMEKEKYYKTQWVAGFVERSTGRCCLHSIAYRTTESLVPFLHERIPEGSVICTDSFPSYNQLSNWYLHRSVNHRAKEYAREEEVEGFGVISVHDNTIEGLWHHLKKKLVNKQCRKYVLLDSFLDEIMFKYSGRSLVNLIKM